MTNKLKEIFNENTKFIAHLHYESYSRIYWYYDASVKTLCNDVAMDILSGYFNTPDNDLATDYLNDKNVEAYISIVCEFRGYRGPIVQSLRAIKPIFIKMMDCSDVNEIPLLLDKINNHLILNNCNSKFIYFDSLSEANNFLKETFDVDFEENNEVFNNTSYSKVII